MKTVRFANKAEDNFSDVTVTVTDKASTVTLRGQPSFKMTHDEFLDFCDIVNCDEKVLLLAYKAVVQFNKQKLEDEINPTLHEAATHILNEVYGATEAEDTRVLQ